MLIGLNATFMIAGLNHARRITQFLFPNDLGRLWIGLSKPPIPQGRDTHARHMRWRGLPGVPVAPPSRRAGRPSNCPAMMTVTRSTLRGRWTAIAAVSEITFFPHAKRPTAL